MQVFLDDRQLSPDPMTLAAALRAGIDAAQRSGRVVVEAFVDGQPIADSTLENPPEEAWGSEVRLTSVEPRALVRATLLDAADALESAAADQARCAAMIQSGRVDESLAPLSAAVQTWQSVREAVEKGAALMRMPLDSMGFAGQGAGAGAAGERLVDLIGSLTSRLEEVKRSLAAQDWSGLADVMAYDMAEQAATWKSVLEKLSEELRGA